MMIAFPLTAAKIVGTDLFQAALLLWVAGFGHFVTGSVDLRATGWLLIGSIPGVLLGSQLTVKLPDRALRVSLALVLSLSGVKLLDPPGANIIILTVIAVAVGVGLALAARWTIRRAAVRCRRPPSPPPSRSRCDGTRLGAGAPRHPRPLGASDRPARGGRRLLPRRGSACRSSAASRATPATTASCSACRAATTTSSSPPTQTAAPAVPRASTTCSSSTSSRSRRRSSSRAGSPTSATATSSRRIPYWDGRSITIPDPDGWRVVLDWGLAED